MKFNATRVHLHYDGEENLPWAKDWARIFNAVELGVLTVGVPVLYFLVNSR